MKTTIHTSLYIYSWFEPKEKMQRCLIWACALFLMTHAALPPGYDEEIYCPPTQCLAPKHQRPGYSGPKTAFLRCCSANEPDTKPEAWGAKININFKNELLAKGYHTETCVEGACDHPTNRSVVVAGRLSDTQAEKGWDNYYLHGGLFASEASQI